MLSIFEKIRARIEESRVYQAANNYQYFIYPYKGISPINPKELDYLASLIAKKISKDIDFIFSFEMDGVFTAYRTASLLKKPFVCARAFHYNLKKPIKLKQKTGYYEREMFFSLGKLKAKKVAIVDCIYSTGGSIQAAIKKFEKLKINVTNVCVVVNKINNNEAPLNKIKDKFFAVFDAEIIDKKIIVCQSKFFK
jgi:adenine/guanine phosphoribosyltransferase-like PRPP-binding protein